MTYLPAPLIDGIPHGFCLQWNPGLLWLHAVSDSVIAASYFVIPVSLVRFARKRRDVPFSLVFLCFGAFILLCGTTHLLDVYNIWVPDWWLSGGVKAATALVSVATAVMLVRLLPSAIALPSPAQLHTANAQLEAANTRLRTEASELESAKAALARAHEDAEELVRVRTAELAEANLMTRRSEARYRALVQASSDIVWTVAPDGTPTDLSEWETFTGIRRDAAAAARQESLHAEDIDRVLALWRHSLESVTNFECEYRLRRADGVWRHVRVQAVPVLEHDGQVREWVGSHADISERVEASKQLAIVQEQLQQSQRLEAIGLLAGGIAHDFNNLLTVINGAGSLIMEEMPDEHPWRRDLTDMFDAGTRAATLTAQLLAYSRKQVLEPRLIDLHKVLSEVEPMISRLIGEQIQVDLRPPVSDWLVQADPGQLQQVILNLAVNARDAMPSGGTLTLESAAVTFDEHYSALHLGVTAGEYVKLSVSDTGAGMDDTTRAQIFEPFFTTKPVGAGTGLGLATVYGIVRQSGGHIYVYSEVGLGTTFTIYLPRATGEIQTDTLTPSDQTAAAHGSETILLVEDDKDVREFVARVLRRAGYTVHAAIGATEALAYFDRDGEHIDMLLSDVVMAGINGRELANLVLERQPGTAVILMSGYTESAIAHHSVVDPRTRILHKPFSPGQLLIEIRRVFGDDEQLNSDVAS